jgi:hypothetical protein
MPVRIIRAMAHRNPLEGWLAGASAVAGAAFLLGAPQPGTIDAFVNPIFPYAWNALLAIGGGLVLISARDKRDVIRSLLTEAAGCFALSVSYAAMTISLLLASLGIIEVPPAVDASAFRSILVFAISIASAWRVWQIYRREVPAVRSVLADLADRAGTEGE